MKKKQRFFMIGASVVIAFLSVIMSTSNLVVALDDDAPIDESSVFNFEPIVAPFYSFCIGIFQNSCKIKRQYPSDDKGNYELRSHCILFQFDCSIMNDFNKDMLDKTAEAVKEDLRNGDTPSRILVSGYTDDCGKEAYNQELSCARACAFLSSINIPEDNNVVNVTGHGCLHDNGNRCSSNRHACRKACITIVPIKNQITALNEKSASPCDCTSQQKQFTNCKDGPKSEDMCNSE